MSLKKLLATEMPTISKSTPYWRALKVCSLLFLLPEIVLVFALLLNQVTLTDFWQISLGLLVLWPMMPFILRMKPKWFIPVKGAGHADFIDVMGHDRFGRGSKEMPMKSFGFANRGCLARILFYGLFLLGSSVLTESHSFYVRAKCECLKIEDAARREKAENEYRRKVRCLDCLGISCFAVWAVWLTVLISLKLIGCYPKSTKSIGCASRHMT